MKTGTIIGGVAAAILFAATLILITIGAMSPKGSGGGFVDMGILCFAAGFAFAAAASFSASDLVRPTFAPMIGWAAAAVFAAVTATLFTLAAMSPPVQDEAFAALGVGSLLVVVGFAAATIREANKVEAKDAPPPIKVAATPPLLPPPSKPAAIPVAPPAPPPQPAKPKEEPSQIFRQRDDRIRELVVASRAKELPLDSMIVAAQLQDIEDDYQRQLAAETKQ